jgi:hypothetical protein
MSRVQMALTVFRFTLPYLVFAVLAVSGAMALYAWHPALLRLADSLLSDHTFIFCVWLGLALAGLDYVLMTIYLRLRLGGVGDKSAAQLFIAGN